MRWINIDLSVDNIIADLYVTGAQMLLFRDGSMRPCEVKTEFDASGVSGERGTKWGQMVLDPE